MLEKLLHEPNLLTPGKKPINQTRLDTQHPLTRGLVFCQAHTRNRVDLVSGDVGDTYGSVARGVDINGLHELHDTVDDHSYYGSDLAASITDECTIMSFLAIDSMESGASIISAPYSDSATWAAPYHAFSMVRDSSSDQGRLMFATSASVWVFIKSGAGFLNIDGTTHNYAVTRVGDDVLFYKDGDEFSVRTGAGALSTDWGDQAPLHLGNRNHLTPGSSTTGKRKYDMVWNRALSADEIKRIYRDPFQFLMPVAPMWAPAGSSGTPVSQTFAAPLEVLQGINAVNAANIETLQKVNQARATNIEGLQGISKTGQALFECLGYTVVSTDFVTPIESKQRLSVGLLSNAESLQGISQANGVPLEVLQGLSRPITVQIESIGRVMLLADGNVEALATVSRDSLAALESLSTISGEATVPLEVLRTISSELNTNFETLLGAGVNVIVDVVEATATFTVQLDKALTFTDVIEAELTFTDVIEKTITFH